jgi:RNA polymerase primary sigma factor
VHMAEKVSRISRVQYELAQKFGREPTLDEVAKVLRVPKDHIQEVMRADQKPTYLETLVGGTDQENKKIGDFLVDKTQESPAAAIEGRVQQQQMEDLLSVLNEKERAIIEMRFGLNQKQPTTLEDTGKHFGLTRERIRQIEVTALRKLRAQVQHGTTTLDDLFKE